MFLSRYIFLFFIFFLKGCVSTETNEFIGKNILDIYQTNGFPIKQFDAGDDKIAYQYYLGGGSFYVSKKTVEKNDTEKLLNKKGFFSQTTTIEGSFHDSEGCIITYLAKKDKKTDAWIIQDVSYPPEYLCE